jgi:hypothetical protein
MIEDLLNTVPSDYNFMYASSLKGQYTNYTSMIFSVLYILVTAGRKRVVFRRHYTVQKMLHALD